MNKILLNNCSLKVSKLISQLFEEDKIIISKPLSEIRSLNEFKMVIMEEHEDHDQSINQIKKIRYACNFRNIAIILFKKQKDKQPIRFYLAAGATEVLYLKDPVPIISQILQGYLIPDRTPSEQEFNFLKPFIDNTVLMLKDMARLDCECNKNNLYFSSDFNIFGDVSGILGLSGEVEGTFIITSYWDLAQLIISKMMGVSEEDIDSEAVHDGMGELINMIGGISKKTFVGTSRHVELSLPTVVIGSGHQIGHPDEVSIVVISFDVGIKSFALQVCFKPKNKKKAG